MTQVGFNYIANPMLRLAREMIAAGELGEIYSFRGVHAEDYMADPAGALGLSPRSGRRRGLRRHRQPILATAEFLLGPIARVMGDAVTVIAERPGPDGAPRAVEVDDVARAFLRFERGASGSLEASWIATGRKMQHDFEVYGSRGGLAFSQERLNELRFFDAGDRAGRQGFRTLVAGAEHPPYGALLRGAGAPARLQRPQGDRDRGLSRRAGGPRAGAVRLPPPARGCRRWSRRCGVGAQTAPGATRTSEG